MVKASVFPRCVDDACVLPARLIFAAPCAFWVCALRTLLPLPLAALIDLARDTLKREVQARPTRARLFGCFADDAGNSPTSP